VKKIAVCPEIKCMRKMATAGREVATALEQYRV
jgi:hypothetical protein